MEYLITVMCLLIKRQYVHILDCIQTQINDNHIWNDAIL
jgi:hypothetical protein